jgi:hypothetical protein
VRGVLVVWEERSIEAGGRFLREEVDGRVSVVLWRDLEGREQGFGLSVMVIAS